MTQRLKLPTQEWMELSANQSNQLNSKNISDISSHLSHSVIERYILLSQMHFTISYKANFNNNEKICRILKKKYSDLSHSLFDFSLLFPMSFLNSIYWDHLQSVLINLKSVLLYIITFSILLKLIFLLWLRIVKKHNIY